MKKLLSLFVFVLVAVSAWAVDVEVDGIRYYIYWNGATATNNYAEVLKPASGVYSGDITIPDYITYNSVQVPVVTIRYEAFKNATISSIQLPTTLKKIEQEAFYSCTQLASISLPESLEGIGSQAFTLSGITEVTIPGNVRYISSAFRNIPTLTKLTLAHTDTFTDGESWMYGEGVMRSDGSAFDGSPIWDLYIDRNWHPNSYPNEAPVTTATRITIGPNVTAVPARLAMNLTLNELSIGDNVTEVGDYAFYKCKNQDGTTNFHFDKLKKIGSQAFEEFETGDGASSAALATLDLSAVEEIGSEAFKNCTSIESLTIGGGTIGSYAFNGCSNITSITLKEGVTEIGSSNFSNLTNLTTVSIPSTMKKIGADAFSYCENMTIPNDLPEGLEVIDVRAFYNCKKLNVNIPSTVTTLGQGAFAHCESLEKVVIPAGVTYLNMSTFSDCNKLTTVTIPGTLLSMSMYDLACENLKEVIFEKGTEPFKINSQYAFSGSPITKLYIDRVIVAPYNGYLFNSGKDIEVEFGPNCTAVGDNLLSGLTNLKSIKMSDNVKSIGTKSIYRAKAETLQVSKKLETIGEHAFMAYTFTDKSFTIPFTVKEIGEAAFGQFRSWGNTLENVYVPWLTPLAIEDNEDNSSDNTRFAYADNQTLWVPGGTMDLYKAAPIWKKFKKFEYWSFVVNASVNGKGGSVLVANGEDVTDNGTNSPITAKAGTPANGLFVREKTIKLAPTADKGYEMSKVVVNGSEIQKEDGIFAVKNLLADQTIEASFTPIIYNLTYDLAGGKLPEGKSNPATYTIESEAITLVNPVRDGYDFAGWTGTDLTDPTMTVTIAAGSTEDRSYTATWTTTSYKLTYDLAGGKLPEGKTNPATYTIEDDAITLVNPVRDGYDFAGWTGTGLTEATKTVVIAKGSTNKRDYTATWTPVVYAITYDLDGGALAEGKTNPETYTIESDAITLNNPTREGYDFAGWTGTGLASATVDVTIAKGSKDKREYKATWTGISYQVEFDANGATGGTAMTNQNFTYGSKQKLSKNTYENGTDYIFYGWNTQADGKGKRYKDEEEVENLTTVKGAVVTLYAEWRLAAADNTYTVSFNANGGEGTMADMSFTYLEEKALTKNSFTRTGYTFAGWNTKQKGGGNAYNDEEVVSSLTPVDKDVYTLYAQWTPIKYAVQFNANGGTGTMDDQLFLYDEEMPLTPNAFKMEGYNFDGWNTQADGKGEKSFTDEQKVKNLLSKDGEIIILYAQYKEITYTISFDPADTKLITATVDKQDAAIASGKIENVYKNKTVVLTAAEGYAFGKTKVNGGAVAVSFGPGGKTVEFTMPMGDATVSYSLQRNLAEGMKVLVGNGTMTKYRVQQDAGSGKWVFVEGLTDLKETIMDEINENLDVTAKIGTDFTSVLQKKADDGSWNAADVATEGYAPGTYRFLVSALSDAYTNQTTSAELSLYFGYELTVPAQSFITYYSDETLTLDAGITDAKLYTITAVGAEAATATELSVAAAQTPLLVKNNSSEAKTFLLVPTEQAADIVTVAEEFKGTLTEMDMPASSGNPDYYVCTGNAFVWVKDAGKIGANKCWLEIKGQTAAARTKSRVIIFGDATGINTVERSLDGEEWYDLNGRKLDQKPTQKGVYIVNGKKQVVK